MSQKVFPKRATLAVAVVRFGSGSRMAAVLLAWCVPRTVQPASLPSPSGATGSWAALSVRTQQPTGEPLCVASPVDGTARIGVASKMATSSSHMKAGILPRFSAAVGKLISATGTTSAAGRRARKKPTGKITLTTMPRS